MEFVLSSLVWMPLLVGVIGIGIELVREIQVTQVCRDAAHMHAYGIDFSQSSNKSLILKTAPNLGLTVDGGNGLILLSTIEVVSEADCAAGGLDSKDCPNFNKPVFVKQISIGDEDYRAKGSFNPTSGPPPTDSTGSVSQYDILNSPTVRATNIGSLDSILPMLPGQTAYVGEMFVSNNDLAWTGFGGGLVTSRSIF